MNTTKTEKTTKRLSLTRETLRTLTKDELRLVAGGAMKTAGCATIDGRDPGAGGC